MKRGGAAGRRLSFEEGIQGDCPYVRYAVFAGFRG